jgi:glycine oxidase
MSASDIVVVGAGVVGCAVACELARRGASVEIVDDRPAGHGATQASAGMLAPFSEAHGGPLLELAIASLQRFDNFVARVTADTGAAINYRRTGTLHVALDPAGNAALDDQHRLLTERGVPAERLDHESVLAAEPQLTPSAAGGLLIPSHGFVSAMELTRAMAAAARHHGAHLIEHGRVRRIVERRGELAVETERGSLVADAVVLAAGSWSGDIAIGESTATVPVRPVRGQLLQLAWQGTAPRRVTWTERCYVVPWDDGTLLVGATVEDAGFDERTTVAGVRGLLEAVGDLLPCAPKARFVSARAGLRPATPDQLPIVGWSSALPKLMFATGHYRNGVLLAPLTAELVADAMLDHRIDPLLEYTKPSRFGL